MSRVAHDWCGSLATFLLKELSSHSVLFQPIPKHRLGGGKTSLTPEYYRYCFHFASIFGNRSRWLSRSFFATLSGQIMFSMFSEWADSCKRYLM